ncbi:MAG: DUF1254 domain-containing protein [Acidimicrobiales bacterium]
MPSSTTGPVDVAEPAKEAFFAGVPLVTTVRTMQTSAQPTSRFVVAANRDTISALAVVDLRSEPQVLTVPDVD